MICKVGCEPLRPPLQHWVRQFWGTAAALSLKNHQMVQRNKSPLDGNFAADPFQPGQGLSHCLVKLHLNFSGDRSELWSRETRCDFVGFYISPGRLVAKLSFVFRDLDAKLRYKHKEQQLAEILGGLKWSALHVEMWKAGKQMHNPAMFSYLSKFKSTVNPGLIHGWTFYMQMVKILLVIQVLCGFCFLGLDLEKVWQIHFF